MTAELERRLEKVEITQNTTLDRLTKGAKTLAAHEVALQNLNDYRDKQNGRLVRIEEKLDQQNQCLMRLMGGIIATLVLLVVNLAVGR